MTDPERCEDCGYKPRPIAVDEEPFMTHFEEHQSHLIETLRSELAEAEGFLSNLIYSSPSPNWLREKGYGDFPGILEQVKEFLARSKKEK